MPDIDERSHPGEPQEDWVAREPGYEDEVPGHTPGVAEGEDEDAPHRAHPFPDPDKTPGRAEG
ncbi:hypothetical protein MYSTI_06044 [Myxococcus stipitatus DSM 14675]|uniref:Uncharacterized protein n=1 Tax=Myxococcus stipitatus (strain DSM 14675 / JCM 12634 / Mx s8) TaxID=1278073 RepID=L7UID7_MYXSD|nr:hypothetical protein [Myxococcus stipitatus]AGC47317.1 hypothetical protein MYSTI_06044 [Myxococcus stipitatus DSM 14675]